jgi:hypothetical protein
MDDASSSRKRRRLAALEQSLGASAAAAAAAAVAPAPPPAPAPPRPLLSAGGGGNGGGGAPGRTPPAPPREGAWHAVRARVPPCHLPLTPLTLALLFFAPAAQGGGGRGRGGDAGGGGAGRGRGRGRRDGAAAPAAGDAPARGGEDAAAYAPLAPSVVAGPPGLAALPGAPPLGRPSEWVLSELERLMRSHPRAPSDAKALRAVLDGARPARGRVCAGFCA